MKNDLSGMRYSKQRELILQQVQELQDHPTAEEIYKTALHLCPSLSLGTVYRNLNSLVEMGKVRRVCIPGQPDRFDHTLPWHGHLYCTRCGRVEDLPLDGEALRRAERSTMLKMDHGSSTYLEVLTARQTRLNAELSQVANRFAELQSVVNLYQALGGGRQEEN